MSWIKSIPFEEAEGALKKIYARIAGKDGYIDNVLSIHSLRPHTLEGHMALYKSVLHHSGNKLPREFLETLGVYVSYLNNCEYCVAHHLEGLSRLLNDKDMAETIYTALKRQDFDLVFDSKQQAALTYARKLTLHPQEIEEHDFIALKNAEHSDGEILEINQVTSYFNYVNRSVLGLGVSTAGDVLGLSPSGSNSSEDWKHE